MRLFMSITPPLAVTRELVKFQQQVQQAQLFDATYVKPENFHVTLLFLGSITDTEFERIQQTFSTVQYNQFSVTLSHIELHQNHDNTDIKLWIVLNSLELTKLSNTLVHTFDRISDHTSRPFIAHITLARIKKLRISLSQAQEIISELPIAPLSWLATSLELQQSILTDQGPIYRVRARTALQ